MSSEKTLKVSDDPTTKILHGIKVGQTDYTIYDSQAHTDIGILQEEKLDKTTLSSKLIEFVISDGSAKTYDLASFVSNSTYNGEYVDRNNNKTVD